MADNKRRPASSGESHIRQLGRRLLHHRNLYVYTIFGFLAALINTVTFMAFHSWWHMPLVAANTLAFIISNLASFYFNQKAVFINNVDHKHSTWHKLLVFFAYRIISLIPDTLIMVIGMNWLHLASLFVKIVDQVLVGIFNYLTTRSVFQYQQHTILQRAKSKLAEERKKHDK